MLHKLNASALNEYSHAFARKISADFFDSHANASGAEILKLTAIPQVNLFLISSLYEKWKADAEAFKSPYFNFEQADVQQALQVFMNVVSQHISVKRDDLEPLLVEATKNTLTLLLNPQQYFNDLLRDQPDFLVKAETVKQLQKYVKINAIIPQTIAEKMASRPTVFVNQAIDWVEELVEKQPERLETIEKWVAGFSDKWPLNLDEIRRKPTLAAAPVVETPSNQSFFDSIPNPVVETSQPVAVEEEAVAAVHINNENAESLNDQLRNDSDSMADLWQKQAIANIGDNIPLAQKFMFIHQLFDGSNSSYETAIETLDQATDYPVALNYIRKLSTENHWDSSSEAVVELLEVVKRRFGK